VRIVVLSAVRLWWEIGSIGLEDDLTKWTVDETISDVLSFGVGDDPSKPKIYIGSSCVERDLDLVRCVVSTVEIDDDIFVILEDVIGPCSIRSGVDDEWQVILLCKLCLAMGSILLHLVLLRSAWVIEVCPTFPDPSNQIAVVLDERLNNVDLLINSSLIKIVLRDGTRMNPYSTANL
jgi:hypothetical protein